MNSVPKVELGKNLRLIRKSRGFTGGQMVEKLKEYDIHINKDIYYAWERCERSIPHKYILPICRIMQTTVDHLYSINYNKSSDIKDAYIKSIIGFLRSLDDDLCKMLILCSRQWQGDFKAALNMLGAYAAQPVEIRRDEAELCFYNFKCALRDGEADLTIANLVDMDCCQRALDNAFEKVWHTKRK